MVQDKFKCLGSWSVNPCAITHVHCAITHISMVQDKLKCYWDWLVLLLTCNWRDGFVAELPHMQMARAITHMQYDGYW